MSDEFTEMFLLSVHFISSGLFFGLVGGSSGAMVKAAPARKPAVT